MLSGNVNEIRDKMNLYGNRKKPFLFAINFETTQGLFIENPLQQNHILFDIQGISNCNKKQTRRKGITPKIKPYPISYDDYKKKFDIVYNGLKTGYSYLTNLTLKTPIDTNLSLFEIFEYSQASYKIFLPEQFVCFSPERFVRICNRTISTNPMKGTIDASMHNAEQIILNDFKETAEHNTIVDLLRNDLSIISDNVRVSRFRYIDRIKTNKKDILQVSSEITGNLQDQKADNLGDIILGMLPAGSVSGAPKQATINLITKAEKEPRGYYTGVFGYYDGNTLDSAVAIRYIEKEGDQLYFRSGGGITVYSDSESEYREVLDKIYLPII